MYVYDITQKPTFDNLRTWIRQSEESTEGFKKIIIGNKSDLEADREVSKEYLKKFCDDKNLTGLEVSAKLGIKISDAFEYLAILILGEKSKEEIIKSYTEGGRERGLSIESDKKNKNKKKKCC